MGSPIVTTMIASTAILLATITDPDWDRSDMHLYPVRGRLCVIFAIRATISSAARNPAMVAASISREGSTHALRCRPQEGRRYPDGGRANPQTGGTALDHLAGYRDRGLLCDLDRGRQSQDADWRQADRPQGRAHVEGDAALFDDRRARLRPPARRHDDRGRCEDSARQFLPATGRDRARLHPRQAAER